MIQKRRRARSALAVAVAVAAVGLLAAGVGARAAEEVKIGELMGVTGPIASFVPALVDAANLATKQINDAGGVLGGKTLRLVIADDQGAEQGAVDAAQKLISVENVPIIVGPLMSGTAIAAANSVTIPAGIVELSPTATSPAITALKSHDTVFRIVPSDTYQGQILAKVVLAHGLKRVALTYVNSDYGVAIAATFRAAYQAAGGTITADQVHEPKKASYRAELATLAQGQRQALVLIAYPGDSGLIMLREALENGLFSAFVGTDAIRDASVIKEIGAENLKTFFGTAPTAPADSPAKRAFYDAYAKAYGSAENKLFIEQVYDATLMAALAIEKAGSTDRTKIRDGLRAIAKAGGEPVGPGEWAKARELIAARQGHPVRGCRRPPRVRGDVTGYIGEWTIEGSGFKEVNVYAP